MSFYCEPCGKKNGWPVWSAMRSRGTCEECGNSADCFDVPSSALPKQDDQPTPTDRVCSVCAGEGDPHTGLPCICGGTGKAVDEERERAKLAQPEEPQGYTKSVLDEYAMIEGTKFVPFSPTPARVEQPASEGGGEGELRNEIEIAWRTGFVTAGPFIGENVKWTPDQAEQFAGYLLSAAADARRVAAPTPPATGEAANERPTCPICGSDMGRGFCIGCEEHPPATPAPVGDVEQTELPELPFIVPEEYLRDAYKLRGLGTDITVSHAELKATWFKLKMREDQLRAERAAHKATREQLEKLQDQQSELEHYRAGEWKQLSQEREAENQELRRKVETLETSEQAINNVLIAKCEEVKKLYAEIATAELALLTAKEGQ